MSLSSTAIDTIEQDFSSFEQTDAEWVDAGEVAHLRHESSRLQHLLQVMPAGVVVLDGKGIIRQANNQALALLGEPLQGQLWRNIISRSFEPKADDGHEVSLKDGRRVKLSITPLNNEPGQLILITDLTETRQLQDKISHMQRLSSLGKMVATLAHQIRTPLSAAILYASNLSSGKLQNQARQNFSEKLQARLHELESQVNDMLLFAKSGENNVVEPLNINTLLQQLQTNLEPMLQQHSGQLTLRLPDQDCYLLGNSTALNGALQNMVHNALQLVADQPHIHMTLCHDKERQHMQIRITDNGPGIASNNINRIFEPFFTTKGQGTGLGLAVVKSVVKSHQGQIEVYNNPQGGATFVLNFPMFDSAPAAQASHNKGESQ